jgi:hypothetical protein
MQTKLTFVLVTYSMAMAMKIGSIYLGQPLIPAVDSAVVLQRVWHLGPPPRPPPHSVGPLR